MISPLIKLCSLLLGLSLAVPSMALSSSSGQACFGGSSSGATSSASAVSQLRCNVAVVNQWDTGYQINVSVTNTGTVKIDKWRVYLTLPNAHVINSLWNAVKTELSPTQIELSNLNTPLLPGQTISVGAVLNKPAGSTGTPTCRTEIQPPANTAPQGEFTTNVINDTVHVKSVNAIDAERDKLTHSFDFGDGTVIKSVDVWHSYKEPGNYTITHIISDGKLTKVNKNTVNVTAPGTNRAPVAVFSYSTSRLSASLNAKGSADKDGQALTYAWDFGQGLTTPSTIPNASASFPHGGGYVALTVFDGELGNTVQYSVPVNSCMSYDAAPILAFSIKADGLSIHVDASTAKIVDGFYWDFGDGSIATGMFANHTYAAPGSYTVTLRGTAQYMSSTKSQPIEVGNVVVDLPPVAELSCKELVMVGDDFENGIAYYSYVTRCDASASLDPEGKPLSYTMNWGDGKTTTANDGIFIYKYLTGGEYNLTLSVSDGVNTAQKSLPWVASSPTVNNRPPVACFDIGTSTDLTVNANCSTDPDGNPLSYSWDFGDGSSATGATALHAYTASGTYTVKLTVSDSKASSSISKTFVFTKAEKATYCEFKMTNSWSGGFTGWLRVYNQSTQPVSNWAAVVTFAEGTRLSSSWNGTVTGSNPFNVSAASWNTTIQPSNFVQIGFQVWDSVGVHQVPTVSGPSCE
ncbi:MAG TPA: PKD domain-containing protein [Cellvibrio sp.]|nr:PKD domain-containing protein [Cellvibrio sp.]